MVSERRERHVGDEQGYSSEANRVRISPSGQSLHAVLFSDGRPPVWDVIDSTEGDTLIREVREQEPAAPIIGSVVLRPLDINLSGRNQLRLTVMGSGNEGASNLDALATFAKMNIPMVASLGVTASGPERAQGIDLVGTIGHLSPRPPARRV